MTTVHFTQGTQSSYIELNMKQIVHEPLLCQQCLCREVGGKGRKTPKMRTERQDSQYLEAVASH